MLQFSHSRPCRVVFLGRGATAAHRTLNPLILVRIQAPRLKYFYRSENKTQLLEEESDQSTSYQSHQYDEPCTAIPVSEALVVLTFRIERNK